MLSKSLRLTIVGLFLVSCGFISSVNATLISDLSERDWQVAGDGGITYDRSTGLEWLDLSYTLGNSILDTEAESFWMSGEFRWATADEVNNLFDAVIPGAGYFSTEINDASDPEVTHIPLTTQILSNARTFMGLLSETPDPTAHTSEISSFSHGISREFLHTDYGAPQWNLYSVAYIHYTKAPINEGGVERVRMIEPLTRANYWAQSHYTFDNMSAWLVRDATASVPEPSTFAIFALGLMGLAARRFKK